MKKISTLLLLCFAIAGLRGQSVKWAEDIAPILYKNCTKCHNPNGAGPFSLITYNDAYNYRLGIRSSVTARSMPPWTPDPAYRHFAGERILKDSEIEAIRNWVDGGAPQGNPAAAPPAPVYNPGSAIVNPDLVLQIPTYTVNTATDLYRCFAIPSGLLADKSIVQMEVLPGNRNIVHHVLVFRDTSSIPLQLDAADPLPGYTNFGGTGSNTSNLIMGWVPGQGPIAFPAGCGVKVPAKSNIILQIHYPGGIANQVDSTRIVLKFSTATGLRNISITPILNHVTSITNGPLFIPANTTRTFYADYRIPVDVTLLGIAPHMHLIGRSIKSYGIQPTGDTLRLINVPQWDFHWQGTYAYPRLLKIPAGTRLKSEAFYDNTTDNPSNPNNPPRDVQRGEATTDEMMLVYFTYMVYQPGDENIIVDSSAVTATNDLPFTAVQKIPLQCYPSPAREHVQAEFDLPEAGNVSISLFDVQGTLVRTVQRNEWMGAGPNRVTVGMGGLPQGAYLLKVSAGRWYGIAKFVRLE